MEYSREVAETKPLFESTGFDKLVAVAGVEAVQNLAGVFESQGRERLGRIEEAIAANDLPTIESETHALGSSAGTFGAERMHVLCRAAEAACMEENIELAVSLSRDVLAIADESFNLAMAYVSSLPVDDDG